jgi:hypothetical protein
MLSAHVSTLISTARKLTGPPASVVEELAHLDRAIAAIQASAEYPRADGPALALLDAKTDKAAADIVHAFSESIVRRELWAHGSALYDKVAGIAAGRLAEAILAEPQVILDAIAGPEWEATGQAVHASAELLPERFRPRDPSAVQIRAWADIAAGAAELTRVTSELERLTPVNGQHLLALEDRLLARRRIAVSGWPQDNRTAAHTSPEMLLDAVHEGARFRTRLSVEAANREAADHAKAWAEESAKIGIPGAYRLNEKGQVVGVGARR